MRRGYRTNLWPGERRGTWCYEVINPEGQITIRGARIGTKAETREHLRKFIKRATLAGGWQPLGLS